MKVARRVRRAAWGNGPRVIPAPRPRPTQPNITATVQGKNYTVKGTPPVQPPNGSAMKDLPVEIHVTCP